ncbi:UDP-glucose dehydrogenase family protein [Litchfieldia salsa]|uniref:UDP-glucose 6-dehydrogenase n=1 Tax=Litchfieldia salsa TaxID=930152 RepID=A0A1H0QCC7_9BACI|nr:UDP-glucose/GDP-mannose dehydrogenase family protein [Litchfieldia salsa]SDP15021.1 UDPglucose 6-dehydrogenase [Litchfieldia salsa]
MEICIVGAGYVGLTTAAVLARLGHSVCCVDINKERIKELQEGKVPIYEPGLKEILDHHHENLSFHWDVSKGISEFPVIMIAVGTPSLPDGKTDLTYLYSVVDCISENLSSYKTIITKSTVPPGTNEILYRRLIDQGVDSSLFNIVSNPEFLREGTAIYDMEHPDKILVGHREGDSQSVSILQELYHGLDAPYVVTSLNGAEMTKYASNAFLALKISFINEMAKISDAYGVNITDVARGIGTDPRIGPHFLQAGLGYGGSCFPKDVISLEHTALEKEIHPKLLRALQEVNHEQIEVYLRKLKQAMTTIEGKTITVLGIAFKPNTDDIRCSPAVELIKRISQYDCEVRSYDPKASLPPNLYENVKQTPSLEQAIKGSDCVVIATDWEEFKEMDLGKLKKWMRGNLVLDARNCLEPRALAQHGLAYIGVARGRKSSGI